MTTAQETYAAMVRDEVAPRLREMGLRGSGGSFAQPDECWWLLVGFQKSRHSDARQVRFTVNVAALDKEAWNAARQTDLWLPSMPTANTNYPIGEWIRIGALLPTHRDRWWTVTAGRRTDEVSSEVVAAIRDRAFPWLATAWTRQGRSERDLE